jgi:hypothetical protein
MTRPIDEADAYLRHSPGSYAAPLILSLRDELKQNQAILARVLKAVADWTMEHEDDRKHTSGVAREMHALAIEDLCKRLAAAVDRGIS